MTPQKFEKVFLFRTGEILNFQYLLKSFYIINTHKEWEQLEFHYQNKYERIFFFFYIQVDWWS